MQHIMTVALRRLFGKLKQWNDILPAPSIEKRSKFCETLKHAHFCIKHI